MMFSNRKRNKASSRKIRTGFKTRQQKKNCRKHTAWTIGLLALAGSAFALYEWMLPPVRKAKKEKYPYALLLGCPCRKDGTPSTSQLTRTQAAIDAWKKGLYETLIISGGAVKTVTPECEQMEKLIHASEPDLPVVLEDQARNTWQNLEYAAEIAQGKPVLIITSDLHARRASAMARTFFSDYGFYTSKDRRLRHILREIVSRIVFIRIELEKKGQKLLHLLPFGKESV